MRTIACCLSTGVESGDTWWLWVGVRPEIELAASHDATLDELAEVVTRTVERIRDLARTELSIAVDRDNETIGEIRICAGSVVVTPIAAPN